MVLLRFSLFVHYNSCGRYLPDTFRAKEICARGQVVEVEGQRVYARPENAGVQLPQFAAETVVQHDRNFLFRR
jgi:hypothetical protein